MDEEGYIYIQDRIKDMIVSGGENVYPRVIEEVLFQHPAIADVATKECRPQPRILWNTVGESWVGLSGLGRWTLSKRCPVTLLGKCSSALSVSPTGRVSSGAWLELRGTGRSSLANIACHHRTAHMRAV
jgi:hypothetical protein